MDWLLRNPQIHSTFGRLGYTNDDGYHINQNCNDALETILQNILNEDKYLRTYRRSINFGQNINKDLIPLLIHTKDDKTIELLISILMNLTIPVECLLAVDVISKRDFRRHTIFDINNLLTTAKAAFTDQRATKVVLVFLKKNLDNEQKPKLSAQQCTNIGNNLLFLRNILHIPEEASALSPRYNVPLHVVQNQILFNLFRQSIDKILIKLMCVPEAANWGVTMVQLIALLYKDQHVVTLHKLLNQWLEMSLSESSEDNESNTSPPDRGSENSSPILMSDPTSDSSDTGGSGKSNDDPNSVDNDWAAIGNNSSHDAIEPFKTPEMIERKPAKNPDIKRKNNEKTVESEKKEETVEDKKSESEEKTTDKKNTIMLENSDYGYGTQIENQESISTSSNDDDLPAKRPTHQKPHNPKQKPNTKVRSGVSLQERKRKKIIKRGKSNIINIQGLTQKTPNDDDISNILKEFTVEFLLKGYNSLVKTLHCQILTNFKLEIDTSHFFWLVTYFLKFATQIELDLNHISSVLSYDIISYLSAEGVNLCEQFELAIKLDGNDLKPCIRRLHLVVTAIREFVQATEVYKKFTHINSEERDTLISLQIKMCGSEELRSLLVLLLRHYNPKYHSKQYLQDLVVTNHTLLLFLDNVIIPDYKETTNMVDHVKQFATPDIMYQYGLLLEDYESNGEYVNDCIFTLMHHVGGELGCLVSLFQPKILKTYTSIWKSEFEICDDWSDLIEYVINTFIKKPHTLHSPVGIWLDSNSMKEDVIFPKPVIVSPDEDKTISNDVKEKCKSTNIKSSGSITSEDRWTEDELSSLHWNYMHCNAASDVVGEIIKLFKEDGIIKSRDAVLRELYKQKLLNKDEFETAPKVDTKGNANINQMDMRNEEIVNLCEELKLDGKAKFLDWVQKVLLETCFVKIYFEKKAADCQGISTHNKISYYDFFKKKDESDIVFMSPVSYHSLIHNQSVPLVPWNCEQGAICKDLKFLQLLHKLGFNMPVDTGKVFIRIPHFWTADFIYEVAGKVAPIDTSKLKFSLSDITDSGVGNVNHRNLCTDITMLPAAPETFYQIHKQNKFATMANYTPMPGSSFNLEHEVVGENTEKGWLDLVRKSQECNFKLGLSRNSPIIEEIDNEPDAVMNSLKEDIFVSPPSVCSLDSIPLVLQNDINSDPSPYSENIPEPEYFKNLCETASVASDLTRMYVSDEEDKSDIVPLRSSKIKAFAADHVVYVDSDDVVEEKRPRVE